MGTESPLLGQPGDGNRVGGQGRRELHHGGLVRVRPRTRHGGAATPGTRNAASAVHLSTRDMRATLTSPLALSTEVG